MGPLDREQARRRGRRKVDAMKRRTGQLRRRVVASAIVGFVLLWTVVFVQMATGNDPALGSGAATRHAAKKKQPSGPPKPSPQPTLPPPVEEASAPVEEPETSGAGIDAERAEAEQIEIEQQEAEARELEALEPVTTGQS